MPIWRNVAALLVVMAVPACSDRTDSRLARCRELVPSLTAASAWEDIEALHEHMSEAMALGCEEVLREADGGE
jgi:hypothetical protein